MEVASPLTFGPSGGRAKRSLACSPQLVDLACLDNLSIVDISEEEIQRSVKRRRLHGEPAVDAISEEFSPSSFYLRAINGPSTKQVAVPQTGKFLAHRAVHHSLWLNQSSYLLE
jgi:hypothetical protein